MRDSIEYEALVQNALRHVIRDILADVAQNGQLPGEHHFYISFATQAPGVQISERLKARFPETMTIVLQHRFWDMQVAADYFTVRLSFGGVSEQLTVPFAAMEGFYDPSSAFEVAFTAGAAAAPSDSAETGESVVAFPPQNREADKKPQNGKETRLPHLPPAFSKALEQINDRAESEQSAPGEIPKKNEIKRPQLVKESAHAEPQKADSAAAGKDGSASVISLDAFRKK